MSYLNKVPNFVTKLVIFAVLAYFMFRFYALLSQSIVAYRRICVLNFEQNGWKVDNTTTWEMLEKEIACSLALGGRYKPETYVQQDDVIIVVPYRDREKQMKAFMRYIHPYLQKKQLAYRIVVIEMVSGEDFNRGFLFNVGFLETIKSSDQGCFIFHDVDLLPENINTTYNCGRSPVHLSSAIDKFKYRVPYETFYGGVVAMTKEHYRQINGFSNQYFGWGAEDDDLYRRLTLSNLTTNRVSLEEGRYHTVPHLHAKYNALRQKLLETMKSRRSIDGLNNIKYQILKYELKPLYTWILVNLDASDITTFGEYNSLLHQEQTKKRLLHQVQTKKMLLHQEQTKKRLLHQEQTMKRLLHQEQTKKRLLHQEQTMKMLLYQEQTKKRLLHQEQKKMLLNQEQTVKRLLHQEQTKKRLLHQEQTKKGLLHQEQTKKRFAHQEQTKKFASSGAEEEEEVA